MYTVRISWICPHFLYVFATYPTNVNSVNSVNIVQNSSSLKYTMILLINIFNIQKYAYYRRLLPIETLQIAHSRNHYVETASYLVKMKVGAM